MVVILALALVLVSGTVSAWSLMKNPHSNGGGPEDPVDVPPVRLDYCTTDFTSTTPVPLAELEPEQAGNAAIIAAVARKRGLPTRAASIAIATAMQESMLRNINYGDRDSLGLFQQRPSQGWGTRKQVSDPVYAANAFYDKLTKVRGYQKMSIAEAAQKVQRSGFPAAYAAYGPTAESISGALDGHSPARLTCLLRPSTVKPQSAGRAGMTGRATTMRTAAAKEAGARTAHTLSPTMISFRGPASTGDRPAWALAQWAVARAEDLNVVEVRVAGRVWDRAKPTAGWTETAGSRTVGVVVRVT